MASEFWLSDQAWLAIEPLLPKNQPGARRVDDRRVISGIVHVLKSGCRWKDCPASYGPPTTIYNRYNRWSRRGIWTGIFTALVSSIREPDELAIDSTYVKAHRSGLRRKLSAARAVGAPWISRRSALIARWINRGTLLSTLAVLCGQQR